MKLLTLLILLLVTISTFSQINLTKLGAQNLPKHLKYEGHIINAVKWLDRLGLNYVITSETGEIPTKGKDNDGLRDAYLYAYHYVVKNDSTKLVWRIYDFSDGCVVDLNVYFVDKTFAVTDLDNNGLAEVWVMYKNSCHGDVSPVPTKIIMYEGNKKYALRGESKVQLSGKDYYGGTYKLDDNFKNGKAAFRQYAENLWNKHILETWNR
ncbi:M949_RS01915 family surface polysaccharide biosynthesis protein [Pinibacter soli]|uniref:VCBS repeat-containing protein n=1 Tax=Pinibacter soli TaxID=3044211 RepID=A0ABT6R6Y6_9BACT|nr:hypothetical protein [Pinibacter soli]MDI3318322.1 hypothetical protein [Pinibacter soli]